MRKKETAWIRTLKSLVVVFRRFFFMHLLNKLLLC